MSSQPDAAAAMKAVTGFFDREDDRFVAGLREVFYPSLLTPFVERWKHDPRPWARVQIFEYLRHPLNVPGHQVVVKRLYKQAEASDDVELMGAFITAFDRLTRRTRARRYEYRKDPVTNRWNPFPYEALVAVPNSIVMAARFDEKTGKQVQFKWYTPWFNKSLRLFAGRTRRYLNRRTWRYLRRLGAERPADFLVAAVSALMRYVDEDVLKPENLLDCRGLMQICFGESPAIDFTKPSVSLRPQRTIVELKAAPRYEEVWRASTTGSVLLKLLFEAPSRTVRVWAKQMLERLHRDLLEALPVETLFRMLDHADGELQQFGATLLETFPGADAWPLDTWLRLLELQDPTALAIVCEQLSRRVVGSRFDVAQTLRLATARAVPIARIGFTFLRARNWNAGDDRRALVALGGARCDAVAGELAKWGLGIAGSGERYDRDVVLALFDSLSEPMRTAASAWFAGSADAQDDPVLWARLIESPYDEVRLQLVEQLQYRAARPRIERDDLAGLWAGVLLGVHRGGRHKLKAVEQLTAAIVDRPESADKLIPVLGAAVRSIRGSEQRAGLAGAARIVERRPELVELLRGELPELTFATPISSAGG